MFSCQTAPKQADSSITVIDSVKNPLDTSAIVAQTISVGSSNLSDTSSNVFVATLKDGFDSVNAKINGNTMFVATKGQLLLYWNDPHTAFVADGRFGYIPPEQLIRLDTPYFKFNFSKRKFTYDKDNELHQAAQRTDADLNALVKRIRSKDENALLQFFKLRDVVDGASAEEFPDVFWSLINLWTDEELSSFTSTLKGIEKKDFCSLLIESSYCNPYTYYKLYYPLTLKEIEATK